MRLFADTEREVVTKTSASKITVYLSTNTYMEGIINMILTFFSDLLGMDFFRNMMEEKKTSL